MLSTPSRREGSVAQPFARREAPEFFPLSGPPLPTLVDELRGGQTLTAARAAPHPSVPPAFFEVDEIGR